MDAASTLTSLGLTLPGPGYLFGSIVFGLIGLATFRHARKMQRKRGMWLSVALMLYPYAVDATWLLYLIGVALCAALWWDARAD
ncbi:MAG: hypothetical protein JWP29_2178 [Rhodoferax sp.]|nr:hypothetical protein [Rhodoferax sp.]